MTTANEREWEMLAADWLAPESAAPDAAEALRRRVLRQGRRLRLLAATEIALAAIYLAGSAWFAAVAGTRFWIGWAAAVWIFTFAVLSFSFWNRHGVWGPAGVSTRHFLQVARERCLRRIRTARFAMILLAAEIAFVIPWVLLADPSEGRGGLGSRWTSGARVGLVFWAALALACAVTAGWAWWHQRRARADLQEIDAASRSLDP